MIKQPVGVQQMTNVAIIRYRMNNKHFEIACYKNKAINWRNGLEKDIGQCEVLQIDKIFTSASHGDIASNKDLRHYFGDVSNQEIIKIILEKGELQLGEKERDVSIHQIYLGIVKFIQEKCVHSVSRRPFNQQSIEHAISKINFIVKPDQPMKKQALACIKLLQEQYCLQRAQMRVLITINQGDRDALMSILRELEIDEGSITNDKGNSIEVLIDPSKFRPLSQVLKDKFKKAVIEVVEADISNREVEDIEQVDKGELEPRHPTNAPEESKLIQQQHQQPAKPQQQSEPKAFKCSMCPDASFDTNAEFRLHYKSDWHNFNLKLKNKGIPTMSNEEYLETILADQM